MRVSWSILGVITLVAFGLAIQGSLSDERKTSPERETAELLDTLVQPRFQVTTDSHFGISRLVPKIQGHGHMGMLQPESDAEKRVLAQVATLGCDYRLGFVHTGYRISRYTGKPVPAKTPDLEMIWRDNTDYHAHKNEELALYKERILPSTERLERGAKLDTRQGEWQIFLRPVKAEKETCVSCHAGVKPGQVMGAMAYLVKRPKNPG